MNPEEELKRLNKLIRQFESVQRSTTDAYQKDRVASELKKLKRYREKVESFHIINKEEMDESEIYDKFEDFPYLKNGLEDIKGNEEQDRFEDREIFYLSVYLTCFEQEFLTILSETKLKLDFKYSLERNGFYHRFEKIRRQLDDIEEDTSRIEMYTGQHEEDMRKRSFKKKRNIILDADRFFRHLVRFSGDLIEDIRNEGMMCLNNNEILHFDQKVEAKKYINGLSVEDALIHFNEFAKEITNYLNVPQIEPQEI